MRGNPHAAFDVAGAGNVAWSRWCDTRRRKGETTGNTTSTYTARRPRPIPRRPPGLAQGQDHRAAPRSTSPPACVNSLTTTFPAPIVFASFSITCPPIRPARSTRLSRPRARRMLRRLEFHYVPKHASWLNMVEIEIGVLPPNASTDASKATPASSPRPPPGRSSAMPPAPASTGCSQPKRPAPKWAVPTRSLAPLDSKESKPRATVLVSWRTKTTTSGNSSFRGVSKRL